MQKRKVKLLINILPVFITCFLLFMLAQSVLADSVDLGAISPVATTGSGTESVQIVIGTIIKGLLGVVGSIAFIMFIYGGAFMLTSHGNTDMVKKGKDVLTWAVIGLVVIFGSYVFVDFIIKAITAGNS